MREIEIKSKTYGDHFVMVDDEDYERVRQFEWVLKKGSTCLYVESRTTKIRGDLRKIHLHRFILSLNDSDPEVDHIDRNPLNNQKNNLRLCSRNQNQFNRGPSKRNKTGFKGVALHRKMKKYRVTIQFYGKIIIGGFFENQLEAAQRYNELARQYHGEFAYQNPV